MPDVPEIDPDSLASLVLAAALVDPHLTWHVEAPDEPTLLAHLAGLDSPPQGDLFEPWTPGDPWRARVLWPLAPTARPPDDAQLDALLAHGTLEPGLPPGRSEWLDRGRLGEDVLVSGPDSAAPDVEAIAWSDLENGGLLEPDVVHHETNDPGITALAYALFAAVGATGTRDADQVSLVQERSTGRFGVELTVAVPDLDPVTERQAVIDGVAAVVAHPPDGAPRLSPALQWSYDLHRMRVWAWLVAPAAPVLPVAPSPGDLGRPNAVARHHGRELSRDGAFELHLPVHAVDPGASSPALTDDALVAVSEDLAPLGWIGGRPRWLVSAEHRVFLATWVLPQPTAETPARLDFDALSAVLEQHVPGRPFRVVPGCPRDLDADWIGIDPTWWASGERVVCRWHCSLRGRDLLPRMHTRDGDAVDRALADRLASLGRADPVFVGPSSARPAVRLVLPAMGTREWSSVVDGLGQLAEPAIGPSAWVAMGSRFVVLLFRTDLPSPASDGESDTEPWVWEARS